MPEFLERSHPPTAEPAAGGCVRQQQDHSLTSQRGWLATVCLWLERSGRRRALQELARHERCLRSGHGLVLQRAAGATPQCRSGGDDQPSVAKAGNAAPIARMLPALAVALGTLLHPGRPAIAETLCRPQITVESVHFSEATNLRRYWTAQATVDASACATSSGLFALGFVRLSETAPDLAFIEPFLWRPGRMSVRVEFWADEAVGRYWIADVAQCPCRGK